jgi:hypothetical protein
MAEATYMKKKMYYNMRIKTMKRNCTNVLKKAQEARQAATSQHNLSINVLVRARKDVEREIDERFYLPALEPAEDTAEGEQLASRFELKRDTLTQAIGAGDVSAGSCISTRCVSTSYPPLASAATHAHAHARARARTHAHTHTHTHPHSRRRALGGALGAMMHLGPSY